MVSPDPGGVTAISPGSRFATRGKQDKTVRPWKGRSGFTSYANGCDPFRVGRFFACVYPGCAKRDPGLMAMTPPGSGVNKIHSVETLKRRQLDFHSFDEVLADIDKLRTGGYDMAGKWDLAQCCGHLSTWMNFAVDGVPKAPLPIRMMLWMLRHTVGKKKLWSVITTRKMKTGAPTFNQTVPTAGGDADGAVQGLKQSIERFRGHAGEYRPSPLFGQLTREQAAQLQLVHCGHHLSFLVPRG